MRGGLDRIGHTAARAGRGTDPPLDRRGRREARRAPATSCDLAAAMGVNINAVQRALRALREEGLLEFRR
jgi:DNA-binding transcriptional ArsR family regulator